MYGVTLDMTSDNQGVPTSYRKQTTTEIRHKDKLGITTKIKQPYDSVRAILCCNNGFNRQFEIDNIINYLL